MPLQRLRDLERTRADALARHPVNAVGNDSRLLRLEDPSGENPADEPGDHE
ncbi:hypothetical protein D3C83_29000 [compost metagenome]